MILKILKEGKSAFWNLSGNYKPNFKSQSDWEFFKNDWFEESTNYVVNQNLGASIQLSTLSGYYPKVIQIDNYFYIGNFGIIDNKLGKKILNYSVDYWLTFWAGLEWGGIASVTRAHLLDTEEFYNKSINVGDVPFIVKDVKDLKLDINKDWQSNQLLANRLEVLLNQKWVLFFTSKIEDSSQSTVIINQDGRFILPYTIIAVPLNNETFYIEGDTNAYNLANAYDTISQYFGNDIIKAVVVNYLPFNDMSEDNGTNTTFSTSGEVVTMSKGGKFYNFTVDFNYSATTPRPYVLMMNQWEDKKTNNNKIKLVAPTNTESQKIVNYITFDLLQKNGNFLTDNAKYYSSITPLPYPGEVLTSIYVFGDEYETYHPTTSLPTHYYYTGEAQRISQEITEIEATTTQVNLTLNMVFEDDKDNDNLHSVNELLTMVKNNDTGFFNSQKYVYQWEKVSYTPAGGTGINEGGAKSANLIIIEVIDNVINLTYKCGQRVEKETSVKSLYGLSLNLDIELYNSDQIPFNTSLPFTFTDLENPLLPNYLRGLSKVSFVKSSLQPIEVTLNKLPTVWTDKLEVKSLLSDQLSGDEFIINTGFYNYETYRNNLILFNFLNDVPINYDAWKTYKDINRINLVANTFLKPAIGGAASIGGAFSLKSLENNKKMLAFSGGGLPLAIGARTASHAVDTVAGRMSVKRSPDNQSNSNADFIINLFFGYKNNNYNLVLEQPQDDILKSLINQIVNYGVEIGAEMNINNDFLNTKKYFNYAQITNLLNIISTNYPDDVIKYFADLFNSGVRLIHYQPDLNNFILNTYINPDDNLSTI